MLRRFRDDMGREVTIAAPPRRIVSLVPSETESLFALGLGDRVVGRTTYCEEPADRVADIATVGGTKDVDVDAVCDLAPDLVFANQEENARPPLEKLAERGVRLFVSFPQRVADAVAHVARMALVCGVESEQAKDVVRRGYRAVSDAEKALANLEPVDVFCPIWLDHKESYVMTLSQQTFGSDMLRLAGARNVFGARERQYPLKADLGLRSPVAADRVANRDKRYPRLSDDELTEMAPGAILLPDEPYEFNEAEADALRARSWKPRVVHVSGKDLFWYGTRIPEALARLRDVIDGLRVVGN